MRTSSWIVFLLVTPLLVFAQTPSPSPVRPVVKVTPLPDDPACTAEDRKFMELAFESARNAVKNGGGPFGAVLVFEGKEIAEFGNCVGTTHDTTKHAETGLISAFTPKIDEATLEKSTLYASSEPCTMCSGAIRFAHIGRVVYGVTESQFLLTWGMPVQKNPLTCKEVFSRTSPQTPVLGPLMEAEGLETHQSFWATHAFKR